MRYSGRNRQKARNRKRVLEGLCLLSWILVIICLVNLAQLRAELKKMDELLRWERAVRTADSGGVQTADADGGASAENVSNRTMQSPTGQGVESYPDKCGLESVARPRQRTESEVIDRLQELGEDNELIADILLNRYNYPEKMLEALANNPEMADFVSGWHGLEETASGGLTEQEMEQDFPLFLQWDPRWGYVRYGEESCIALVGCGPTCLSMVLYYLTGDESITPDAVGAYSMANGCYIPGTGTAWVLMEDMPREYGIHVRQPKASESELKEALDDGSVIILSMGPGEFTAAGHFIVVYGYDENGFMVNDPNCVARSRRQWSFSELEQQIKNTWVFSGKNKVDYVGSVITDHASDRQ